MCKVFKVKSYGIDLTICNDIHCHQGEDLLFPEQRRIILKCDSDSHQVIVLHVWQWWTMENVLECLNFQKVPTHLFWCGKVIRNFSTFRLLPLKTQFQRTFSYGRDCGIAGPNLEHLQLECSRFERSGHIQSDESPEASRNDAVFFAYVLRALNPLLTRLGNGSFGEKFNVVVETVCLNSMFFRKCENFSDYFAVVRNIYLNLTGRSIFLDSINVILKPPQVQEQSDYFDEFILYMRNTMELGQNAFSSKFYKHATEVYTYCFVSGFLSKLGLEVDVEKLTKDEVEKMEITKNSPPILAGMNLTLTILEKINMYRHTGEFTSVLHSSKAYHEWFKEADRLLALAPFTGNLAAQGTTYFAFKSDLDKCLEKGEAYCSFSAKVDKCEISILKKKCQALTLVRNIELARKAASTGRSAPFGVLLYGKSSVGKSTFISMLYHYFGELHGLDTDPLNKYTRNPANEYYDNFKSSQWCIVLDDIAATKPSKNATVDPSLKEMIGIINNIDYTPVQASLDDKGKTPVLCDLVLCSTNVRHLWLDQYFSCPIAVQRRLPLVVEVVPKQEYMDHETGFIRPELLETVEGEFPDFWNIRTYKLQKPPYASTGDAWHQTPGEEFTSTKEFLKYFGEVTTQHKRNQASALASLDMMRKIKVCPVCLYASSQCECSVQAAEHSVLTRFLQWYFRLKWNVKLLEWLTGYAVVRSFVFRYMHLFYNRSMQINFIAGARTKLSDKTIQSVVAQILLPVIIALSGFYLYKSYTTSQQATTTPCSAPTKNDEEDLLERSQSDEELGAGTRSVTISTFHSKREINVSLDPCPEPIVVHSQEELDNTEQILKVFEKEQTRNVWYNSCVEITAHDVPRQSASMSNFTEDDMFNYLRNNTLYVIVKSQGKRSGMNAFSPCANYIVTHNHAFKRLSEFYEVELIQGKRCEGITPNLTVRIYEGELVRMPDLDLVLFEVRSIPPFRDIRGLFGKKTLPVTSAMQMCRAQNGDLTRSHVRNLQVLHNVPIEELNANVDLYHGRNDTPPQDGWCGSLLVSLSPRGPIILGSHVLGSDHSDGSIAIVQRTLAILIGTHAKNFGERYNIHGKLMLSAEGYSHEIGPLHSKSPLRYVGGTARVYGTLRGFRPKPRSRVEPTILSSEFLAYFGCPQDHGAPQMNGYIPWRMNLVEMVQPRKLFNGRILNAVKLSFIDDIMSGLSEADKKRLPILNREATVNGLPGVKFIDGINRNTSMGHPYNKTKKAFLLDSPSEMYPEGVDFPEEVWERCTEIEECFRNGERANVIFTNHLKDEARTLAKCKSGATRIFSASPADFSNVVRKHLLTFVKLVQDNSFTFEAAPGVNPMSSAWGDILYYITFDGLSKERMVAGDFKAYDKTMGADWIRAAFDIILHILRWSGRSESDLRIVAGIGIEIAYAIQNFNGDIVMFFGTNPSGHPLTVIINSLVNSLYMRYCYTVLNPDVECASFKRNVHLLTYGDDNIMGVSPECHFFNHTAISLAMESIGITYTMADKNAESVPFIPITECSFLKRKWLWDENIGAWCCPLEEASIRKSLTIWVRSNTIDPVKQMAQIMISAHNEYFFHGREVFETHRVKFLSLIRRESFIAYVSPEDFPSWSDLYKRFWDNSKKTKEQVLADLSRYNQSQNHINHVSKEATQQCKSTPVSVDPLASYTHSDVLASKKYVNLTQHEVQGDETDVPTNGEGDESTHQTVTFVDSSAGVVSNTPTTDNKVAKVDGTEDIGLGAFLSRPTLIDTTTVTIADVTGIKTTLKPWNLFLNNSVIKRKLDNYAFMRATLHVKILVNGTPFQYGLIKSVYYPLLGFSSTKIRGSIPGYNLIPLSQMQGVHLHPQANAGGEMALRFFLHKNWLDITSASETINMGTLYHVIFDPLKIAVTGSSTSVTIRTFAWLSDVELMASTAKMAVQGDEYGNGPVSRPASQLAAVASMLTTIPTIGPFARATQIGASAVSTIATMFGYTNVPVIDNVTAYQPMNAPMLASAHIGTPIQKLTLDPKQELSIDPAFHGIGSEDELAMHSMTRRESFFGATSWQTADSANTILFNCRVTPDLKGVEPLLNSVSSQVGARISHTPLSYVGAQFAHWRGGLKIRMKVVCSKFHKGRLRISYDPRFDISTSVAAENAVYTEIVDIGEKDDFELVIPYHQDVGWLQVASSDTENHNLGTALAPRLGIDNGTLSVSVMNTLVAPTSSSVTILFYVSGHSDFEFANPSSSPDLTSGTFVKPTFYSIQGDDNVDITPSLVTMGTPSTPLPDRYAVNFGEPVGSLRNLMHRYSNLDTLPCPVTGTTIRFNLLRRNFKRLPSYPGFNPNASYTANKIVAASGTAPFLPTCLTPTMYFTALFLGYRGSVNYAITPAADLFSSLDDVRVMRLTDSTQGDSSYSSISSANGVTFSATSGVVVKSLNTFGSSQVDGCAGMAITSLRTNGSLTFNFPDYNNYNFGLVDFAITPSGSNAIDGTKGQCVTLRITTRRIASTDPDYALSSTVQTEHAAGPDYTCLHFLCCPTLDYVRGSDILVN